jgi:hypothetical protein
MTSGKGISASMMIKLWINAVDRRPESRVYELLAWIPEWTYQVEVCDTRDDENGRNKNTSIHEIDASGSGDQ